jgi:DNA-binding MarR family transcriptional regulator
MTREEVFQILQEVNDMKKDYSKILSIVHYTHYYLLDEYKKTLKTYDITTTQSNVLGIIVYQHPKALSLEEIKSLVLEPNSDVSRTVDRLQAKGFVEKVVDPENRRKRSILSTAKGREIIKAMSEDSRFHIFTNRLTLEEARELVRLTSKLRAGA